MGYRYRPAIRYLRIRSDFVPIGQDTGQIDATVGTRTGQHIGRRNAGQNAGRLHLAIAFIAEEEEQLVVVGNYLATKSYIELVFVMEKALLVNLVAIKRIRIENGVAPIVRSLFRGRRALRSSTRCSRYRRHTGHTASRSCSS